MTPAPRERLLEAAVEHFAVHGIGDTSLRGIAEAVGTSHRMLIYHFGSREGLLVEATLRYGPLFFELTAHAMQGKEHAEALRSELIGAWLPSVTELCRAIGIPEDRAETHARLALGAARGLLLDLLVTGERAEVAQAADLLNRLLLLSAESKA